MSVFGVILARIFCIRTECKETRENTDQNNSEYWHFLRSENWHSLSHEQYFSTHSFLDICLWVCNITTIFIIVIIIIVIKVSNCH